MKARLIESNSRGDVFRLGQERETDTAEGDERVSEFGEEGKASRVLGEAGSYTGA